VTALVDDPLLPAAPFLTSDAASSIVATAVALTGAELRSCIPVQVQYRPGSDLVVRYRVTLATRDTAGQATVMAGTTAEGPHPGTLALEADVPDAPPLSVGVWRWPFDPVLTGLTAAVSPGRVDGLLAGHLVPPLRPDVVVYRPTERAVVRITDARGRNVYLKVVPPATLPALVARHTALGAAGLPVPAVLAADAATGIVALAELPGPTVRDLLKGTPGPWPGAAEFLALRERLATVSVDGVPLRAGRRRDASAHAAMLATVLPSAADRISRIVAAIGVHGPASGAPTTIHTDLHEAQMIVADGRVVGLLDIDDVGPGDPLDDLATLLGHLRYRAATEREVPERAAALDSYTNRLRAGFTEVVDATQLDASTAAVLVGLATGPFRVQATNWQSTVGYVLAAAESTLMSELSDSPHRPPTSAAQHHIVGTSAGTNRTSRTGAFA